MIQKNQQWLSSLVPERKDELLVVTLGWKLCYRFLRKQILATGAKSTFSPCTCTEKSCNSVDPFLGEQQKHDVSSRGKHESVYLWSGRSLGVCMASGTVRYKHLSKMIGGPIPPLSCSYSHCLWFHCVLTEIMVKAQLLQWMRCPLC